MRIHVLLTPVESMESKAREMLGGIDGHPPPVSSREKVKSYLDIYTACGGQGDKAAIKPATGSFSRVKWNRFDFVSNEAQGAAIQAVPVSVARARTR